MNSLKRLVAIALVLVMVLSFAGCHKKNEIAVKIGDVEFTSAYYMCALMNSDASAKNKVSESLTDEEKSSNDIDYYSKKIDGKSYVKWVEEDTITSLKKIAAYKILCKKADVKPDEEATSQVDQYAEYYWKNYGYSQYFEPNGVGFETYKQYMLDGYYSDCYFEKLYGEGGEKAIDSETVKSKIFEKYIVANALNGSYEENATDEQKAALKAQFDGYLNDIKSKNKTFREIYMAHNNITEDQLKEAEASEEDKPQDLFATVLGASDTSKASNDYDTVNALAVGEGTVVESDSGVTLYIKQDINADPYYVKSLDMDARHLIADENYEKYIEDYIKDLKPEINKNATKQFMVKKIVEPEAQG